MKKVQQKKIVVPEKVEEQAELIQDEALIENGNHISFEAFKNWSWNLVRRKKYAGKYFLIYLIMFGIGLVMSFLDYGLTTISGSNDSGVSFSMFSDIANIVFAVGLLGFSINVAKGLEQKVKDFFHEITWDRFWKILCISIIIGVIVIVCCVPFMISAVGGFKVNVIFLIIGIILILLGIFVGIRLQFAQYAVVDKGYLPREALIYSRNITKGRFREIIGFDCYFILINLLGMLCLFIGLIRTSAMTNISIARYYRLISNMYDNKFGK